MRCVYSTCMLKRKHMSILAGAVILPIMVAVLYQATKAPSENLPAGLINCPPPKVLVYIPFPSLGWGWKCVDPPVSNSSSSVAVTPPPSSSAMSSSVAPEGCCNPNGTCVPKGDGKACVNIGPSSCTVGGTTNRCPTCLPNTYKCDIPRNGNGDRMTCCSHSPCYSDGQCH